MLRPAKLQYVLSACGFYTKGTQSDESFVGCRYFKKCRVKSKIILN